MSTSICLWKRQLGCGALSMALAAVMSAAAFAQGDVPPAGFEPEIPARYSGSGSFFNRQLGTALRLNYHTEGYGTERGVVSIGAMKVTSIDDSSTWFFDGQGTLSDDFGGGFNAGVGYRVLTDLGFGFDSRRIHGLGFWTDGQSTQADNFFTQLGFSLESLGDSLDFRINGHFPLDRTQEGDPVLTSIDALSYVGNNLFSGLQDVTIDTAHSVVDGEIAKRILNLEAWGFAGAYQLGGGGLDVTGYRAGVRGYAVPDLALSLQVTDDDVYHTNVMFGITWFVGRTTRNNQPCGTILDRLREPVIRNDFIAVTSRVESRAAGDALTDTETSAAMRIVHVDSNAAAGGDGTFENPYDTLAGASGVGNSIDFDKILVHAGSTFAGADGQFIAQNDQDVLGEGLDADGNAVSHIVGTIERGLIALPETSTGSSTGARAIITGAADVFTLADNNAINNFQIDTAARAVVGDGLVTSVTAPLLSNLDINGTTGDSIYLKDVTGATVIENTVIIDDAVGAALFIDGGEDGMSIAALITDSQGRVMVVRDRLGGTITYTGSVVDNDLDPGEESGIDSAGFWFTNNTDATINLTGELEIDTTTSGGDGIAITDNTNSIVNVSGTTTINSAGNNAVTISGNNGASGPDAGTTVTFDDLIATAGAGNTVDIIDGGNVTINTSSPVTGITNDGTGDAVHIAGDLVTAEDNAIVNIGSSIDNSTGGNALDIQSRSANNVTVSGNVTGSAEGILLQNNTDGTYDFTGEVRVDTTAGNAFTMINNEGATVTLNDVQLSSFDGDALSVTGDGTLTITDPNATNEIEITTLGKGNAVKIIGDDYLGVSPNDPIDPHAVGDAIVSIDAAIINGSGATGHSVLIQSRTSNDVTFNGTILDEGAGLLIGGSVAPEGNSGGNILFTDTVTTNNSGSHNGITLDSNTDTTISFNGLDITTTDGTGFSATAGGNLVVTSPAGTNTIETTGTGTGLELDNMTIDAGNVTFDSITVAGSTNEGIKLATLDGTGQVSIGGGSIAGDGGTISSTGTAISVNNVDNLLMTNVTVDNTAGITLGPGLDVTGQDDGTATFTGLNVTTSTTTAVNVNTNTGGTIAFNDLTADTTTSGDAVILLNNTGATVTFDGMEVSAAGTGKGFSATGGGNLAVTGTNNVSSENGIGVELNGMDIEAANATFTSVNVTNGSGNAIKLDSLTGAGQVTIGSAAGAAGSGGTLKSNAAAISVTNSDNVTLNNINVDNIATAGAGLVASNIAGDTLTLRNLDITTSSGLGASISGAGTFTTSGTNDISTGTGIGLTMNGVTIGGAGATFNSVDANGANGITLLNIDGAGQLKIDGGTLTTTSTAITVDNVDNLLMTDVTVANGATTGEGLTVTNQDGGSATFTNLNVTTDAADAVTANANTAGTISFNNLTALTATGDVVTATNNTGATITFNGMSLTSTGSGAGFIANSGGNLTALGTNTISTKTGTGLDINGVTVGVSGANFASVDVDGADNGIKLTDLTSGQVRVGAAVASGNPGDGGTLNTDDTAIVLSGVTNAVFNDVTVTSNTVNESVEVDHTTGADASIVFDNLTLTTTAGDGAGLVVMDNGTGELDVVLRNSTLNTQASDTVAFELQTFDNAGEIDVSILDSNIDTGDASAILADIDFGTGDVQFLMTGNNVNNDSATGKALDLTVSTNRVLNATIGNQLGTNDADSNTFTNANVGAGTAFELTTNHASARINADIRGNTANGFVKFSLDKTLGNFGVVDRTETITNLNNNTGTFNLNGDIETDFDDPAPPIKQVD